MKTLLARWYSLLLIMMALPGAAWSQPSPEDCKKCILLAEQAEQRVAIADAATGQIVWE